jgi:PAS domain S-box-containing protein
MYDLTSFTLEEMTECGDALRRLASGAGSLEEVANRIVRHLYDQLGDGQSGRRACALVRCFTTLPCVELEPELRAFAQGLLRGPVADPAMKCLVLLATSGEKAEWNARETSVGHRAVPLVSEKMGERFPMVSNLIKQLGLDISTVLKPEPSLLVDLEQKAYNVFYVPKAPGSPFVTAQEEFVVPYGIESVLGFGGLLPSGNLFVILLFSRVPISRETADRFRTLALSAKIALLPFDGDAVFAPPRGADARGSEVAAEARLRREVERFRSRTSALEQLLEVYARTALDAASTLETQVEARTAELARANEALQGEIREHQQDEASLRESEGIKAAMLQSALDAIITINGQGIVVEWNPAAEQIFGYSRAEAVGQEMATLILPPALREAHRRGLARYLQTGEGPVLGKRLELTARRKDGSEFPVEIAIVRIAVDGPPLFTGYVRDISERKQVEAALQRAEREKKRFYREVICVVTDGRFHLVDAGEIPTEGRLVFETSLEDLDSYRILRQRVHELAASVGMASEDAADIVMALGEAVTNAIKHAVHGRCSVRLTADRVIVRVSDRGAGILMENLPNTILQPGFSTKVSLGMGYTMMLGLADRVWLATGPEGTEVQLEKWIHPQERPDPLVRSLWKRY